MFSKLRLLWFSSLGLLLVALATPTRGDDYEVLAAAIASPLYRTLDEAHAGYRDNAIILRAEVARRTAKELAGDDEAIRQVRDDTYGHLDNCRATLERIRQLDKQTPDYLGILDKTVKAGPAMSRRDPVTNKLLPADQDAVNLLIAKAAGELIKVGINQYQLTEEWKSYHRQYTAARKSAMELVPIARSRPCLYSIGIYRSESEPGEEARLGVGLMFQGCPAEKAGIVTGDTIVAVNGKPSVVGGALSDVAVRELSPGVFGSDLTLRIERDGVTKDYALKRTFRLDNVPNLLTLKLSGSRDGAYPSDELFMVNNARRELTNCTLLVSLTDGPDVLQHVHFVQCWPAGEELIAKYHNDLSSSIARDSAPRYVQSVKVELYSDQFQGTADYSYWDSPERVADIQDYVENEVRFSGNFIAAEDGLFGKSDAAVRVWLKQGKGKVPPLVRPSEVTVTVGEGRKSATETWKGSLWEGDVLFPFKTFSSSKFNQFQDPDYYEVRLSFFGTEYERVLTFGDKPQPPRDLSIPRVRRVTSE